MPELIAITPWSTTVGAVAAFFAWTLLYCTLCVTGKARTYEWHCRSVTVVHALVVVSLSAWCGFIQGPWPITDPAGPNTVLQHVTCTLCLGYFVFDFLWCLYFRTEGITMLAHHVVSIFGQMLTLYKGVYGAEMIATIFGTEITNPLLQLRWFLRECDKHRTWYGEINDFAFMALFGIMRCILATWLLVSYFSHPRPDWVSKSGGLCIYVIGWIFWFMIVKYAIKKYTKMLKDWQSTCNAKETSVSANGYVATQINGHSSKKTD